MTRTTTVALLAALAGAAHGQQEFKITFTDLGPQPLAPLFYSASTSAFDLFDVGGTASAGIAKISEYGDTSVEKGIAAASSAVESYGAVGGGPIVMGQSESTTFFADSSHPYLSLAAMLGITNDGFIGDSVSSAGLLLFNGNTPVNLNLAFFGSDAWDAGAAEDAQTATTLTHFGGTPDPLNGVIHTHLGLIPGVGDYAALGLANYNWTSTTLLATVNVQSVPEPAPAAALALGVPLLFLRRRKRSG